MIVAIHQPNFLPWIGYFYKIAMADVFVLLDDVQYTKNSFINRNKIKNPNGEQWLTVPVITSGGFGQNINNISIFQPEKSIKKVLSSLNANYGKTPFFKEVSDLIMPCFDSQSRISDLNEALIKTISNYLGISTKIIKSSELTAIEGQSSERLVSICKALDANTYLAGFGSENYQEDDKFKEAKIISKVYNFKHPAYSQNWGEFIPNMSIIDLLFNMGSESQKFFKG